VLLVSADLRRPRVHQFFGLPNESGLSDLRGDGGPADAPELWSVAPNLRVLLSGPPPAHPQRCWTPTPCASSSKEQRDRFDFIILDCRRP
jgi:Mrp family chromosome partitioning ATPase